MIKRDLLPKDVDSDLADFALAYWDIKIDISSIEVFCRIGNYYGISEKSIDDAIINCFKEIAKDSVYSVNNFILSGLRGSHPRRLNYGDIIKFPRHTDYVISYAGVYVIDGATGRVRRHGGLEVE